MLDDILQKKKDNTPLILYAPQDKGKIAPEDSKKKLINIEMS